LAAIWAELARRGEMERVMEDERQDDIEAGGEQEYCQFPGCIEMARRDGLCTKHLIKLVKKDPEAIEATRQWHAIHDRQVIPPADAHWRTYPWKAKSEKKASGFRPQASGTAAETAKATAKPMASRREAPGLEPEALLAKSLTPSSSKETTMSMDKITCPKCGKLCDPRGFGNHKARCKGPAVGPACPICGKVCKNAAGVIAHRARTAACRVFSGEPPRQKRKYTSRATPPPELPPGAARPFVNQTAGVTVRMNLPVSAISPSAPYPSPAMATLGYGFIRLAELLGLAEILADYPHPDGLVFVNTQTGGQALVTAAGEIEAVELIRRSNA